MDQDHEMTEPGSGEAETPEKEADEDQEAGEPGEPQKEPIIYRLYRAFGPLAGGLILDMVDLATFGPLGIAGFFIGGLIGWWISSIYGFSRKVRLAWALLAGFYCLVPFTEFVPVATIISACARVRERPNYRNTDESKTGTQGKDQRPAD